MRILRRNDLMAQLKDMLLLLEDCSEEMSFHVNVEFAGIDSEFMEISKKLNDDRKAAIQKMQADIREKGGI